VERLRWVVAGDIRTLFDADGDPIPIKQLSAESAALLHSWEIILKNAEAGDGHIDRVLKIRTKDQLKAIELAMKYLGMFKDVVEVNVDWDKLAARLMSVRDER